MASSARVIETSTPDTGIRFITLHRPQKRNALSKELIDDLLVQLRLANKDPAVRVIVISGAGSFFSAGADLNDIAALDDNGARECRYLEDLCQGLAAVRKPLVAAVNGPALGGGFEVALACDLIFASKSAYFALPEVKRGLIPGAGGTQRLTAALGKYKAMKTILLGRPINPEEGLNAGLVCEVFDDQEFTESVMIAARDLSKNAPIAAQLAKEAICRADDLCRDDLYERNLYYTTFGTAEKRQGVDEFLKKKTASTANGVKKSGAS